MSTSRRAVLVNDSSLASEQLIRWVTRWGNVDVALVYYCSFNVAESRLKLTSDTLLPRSVACVHAEGSRARAAGLLQVAPGVWPCDIPDRSQELLGRSSSRLPLAFRST